MGVFKQNVQNSEMHDVAWAWHWPASAVECSTCQRGNAVGQTLILDRGVFLLLSSANYV